MPYITFHSFRLSKLFALLCVLLIAVVWIGYHFDSPTRAVYVATIAANTEKQPSTVEIGMQAPDFTLSSIEGRSVALSAYTGRPVIVYFWAIWCPYCLDAMPRLVELRDAHSDDGLEILAIDILERREKVAAYAERLKLSFPVLLDADADVAEMYLVQATPTYVFIDREGVVQDILIGSPRRGAVEGRLAPLLKQPDQDPLSEEIKRR